MCESPGHGHLPLPSGKSGISKYLTDVTSRALWPHQIVNHIPEGARSCSRGEALPPDSLQNASKRQEEDPHGDGPELKQPHLNSSEAPETEGCGGQSLGWHQQERRSEWTAVAPFHSAGKQPVTPRAGICRLAWGLATSESISS